MTLKSIKISAFRGASEPFELNFEAKKKLTIIYGENGTGKTTICDAFEFLAKGDVGSLRDKGIDGTRHKYLHSAQKNADDLVVSLETAQGAICTGKLVGKNALVTPEANRPRLEIMRRKQMLDFVEATPGDRYKAIAGFIDISAFELSEGRLKTLLGDLGNEKTNADAAVYQSYTAIFDIFTAAGNVPGQNPVEWAEELLAQAVGTEAEEQGAVDALIIQYQGLGAYPGHLQQQHDAVLAAQTALNAAQDAMTLAAGAAAANAEEIITVLEAGESYLQVHPDSEVCPLCESAERATGLANKIKCRLEQFAAVSDAKIKLDKCGLILDSATGNLNLLKSGYLKSLEGYQTARTNYAWDQKYSFPASLPPQDMSNLQAWLNTNNDLLQKWKDIDASLRLVKERRENAKLALNRYNENAATVAGLKALIPMVEQAHAIVKTKRQEFTDTVISEIAGKAGELYELVHPGEGKNKIALELDHAKRASIDLNAEFSGKGAPPQAYFSQSHLDTLGLCIFLALAMREKPEEAILILDDVLGSVDEPHVDRVIDMVYAAAKEFRHTIVTTHYGPWRHKYRWGMIPPDQPCQFIELMKVGGEGVIATFAPIPEIALLKIRLNEPQKDMQGIVSKAGVILEAALDFLTQKYQCSVPRKVSGDYTLGDLLPNVKGKLRDELRIDYIDGEDVSHSIAFKTALDGLSSIMQLRNLIGAHFNTLSFEMLDADALAFARHVESLGDALICADHGWPTKNKTGSYWHNGGDTRRLYPVMKPA